MNAPGASKGKPDRRRRQGGNDQRPPHKEPEPQDGTSSSGRMESPTIPPRLVEFLPRAGKSALASLLKRGLPGPVAEDIVQEVAYRAAAKGIDPPSYRSLARWMHVAVHNRAATWLQASEREAARRTAVGDADQLVAAEDTATHVEQRAFLQAVALEFVALRSVDQEVIAMAANELRPGRTKRERDRFSLRLHRARSRLEARLRDWLVAVTLRLRLDDFIASAQHIVPLTAAIGVAGASAALGVAASAPAAASEKSARPLAAESPASGAEAGDTATPATTSVAHAAARDSGVTVGTTPTTVPPVKPAPAVPYQRVDIRPSDGSGVEAETREIPPKAPLLCLTNMPVAGTNCVPHPLRG
ncbi:MAG: hypothetical protein M3394_07990 [Actinomycetota bacterium]|nr:hypothetical protein [Actinomycetota bacterium]